MSANGEIEIAVTAEGADEAAAELSEGGDGGGGGMPTGGGGGRSLRGNLKSGAIAGLLLSLLGPLLDVLNPIMSILQAFLAPLAVMLLRLFTPVLRLFIQLLPAWFSFISEASGWLSAAVNWLQRLPARLWAFMTDLPGMTWDAIARGASWLTNGAVSIGEAVWDFTQSGFTSITTWLEDIWDDITTLPSDIASAMKAQIPFFGGGSPTASQGAVANQTGLGFQDRNRMSEEFVENSPFYDARLDINQTGSATAFIERTEVDTTVERP